jgi:hypothetical protein
MYIIFYVLEFECETYTEYNENGTKKVSYRQTRLYTLDGVVA